MKRSLLFAAASCLLLCPTLAVQQARAQTFEMYGTTEPQYLKLVLQATTYIPETFPFGSLRVLYSQTSFYDPIGEETQENLLEYAYTVQTSNNPEKADNALREFLALRDRHLANLGVLYTVISLARTDQRFGDTKLLTQLKEGLQQNLFMSGNGKSLAGAYDILSLFEETLVLMHENFNVVNTEYNNLGQKRFNMHYGYFPGSQEEQVVFTDVSIPMKYLESQKQEEQPAKLF